MDQKELMKETRMALNARLFFLFAGVMLVMNALTSTGRNALGYLQFAGVMDKVQVVSEAEEAAAESFSVETATEEVSSEETTESASEKAAMEDLPEAETEPDMETVALQLKQAGVTSGDMRLVGIVSLIAALFEVAAGVLSVVFSNRVDRWKITLAAAAALLAAEVLCLVVLFVKGALMLAGILSALLLPLVLLWSALRYRKLALADPARAYAVEPNKRERPTPEAASAKPARSLRERAMVSTEDDADAEADPDTGEIDVEETWPD